MSRGKFWSRTAYFSNFIRVFIFFRNSIRKNLKYRQKIVAALTNHHSLCPVESSEDFWLLQKIKTFSSHFCNFERFFWSFGNFFPAGFQIGVLGVRETFWENFAEIFFIYLIRLQLYFFQFFPKKFRPGCKNCIPHVRRKFLKISKFFKLGDKPIIVFRTSIQRSLDFEEKSLPGF